MTDNKKNRKIIATDGLAVDILMSFIFALSAVSVELVAIKYVQLDIPYQILMLQTLIVIVFALLRRLQVRVKFILIAHPVAALLTLIAFKFVGGSYYKDWFAGVFLFAVVFFNMLYSISCLRARKAIRALPEGVYFALILHLLLFFAVGFTIMIYPILVDAALIIMCYLAARQVDIFESKYAHSISTSSQTSSEIRKNNRLTVVLLLFSVMVSLCALFLFPYDAFYALTLMVLRVIIRFILSFAKEEKLGNDGLGGLDQKLPVADEGATPLPLKILFAVIAVVVALLIVNFFGTLIVNFIKSFRLPEFEKYKDEDKEENEIVTDIIEDIGHDAKLSVRRKDFGKGEEYRIRKKYYDKVRKAIKKGVAIRRSSTPGQIEKLIADSGDTTIKELTPLYQEIRYNKKGSSD